MNLARQLVTIETTKGKVMELLAEAGRTYANFMAIQSLWGAGQRRLRQRRLAGRLYRCSGCARSHLPPEVQRLFACFVGQRRREQ